MPSLVVPFRGAKGKSRLGQLSGADARRSPRRCSATSLGACTAVGPTFVVGPAGEASPAAERDGRRRPGRRAGCGRARRARGRRARAGGVGPFLVVNADLPCVTARDLLALAGAVPDDGLALAPAADGTTNALALSSLGRVRAGLRPRERGAVRGARALADRSRRRISSMTWTRPPTSSVFAAGSAHGHGASSPRSAARGGRVKATVLSGGVGGARFLRGVVCCRRTRQRQPS